MKRIAFILSVWAFALGLGLVSCSKNEESEAEPVQSQEAVDEASLLADHMDVLTKSLTPELWFDVEERVHLWYVLLL